MDSDSRTIRKYPGFTEHTYRIVFPFEERFAPLAPNLLTILPSGTVENNKVLEPKKDKGLITFAYPQTISDEAAELPVPQSQDGSGDSSVDNDGKGRKVFDTEFVWRRQDGTNALVQTWATNINQQFRKDFEISEGVNEDATRFLPQAAVEFQQAMVQLFGHAANSCPLWFCHKQLTNASPAVVGLSEDVLAYVNQHPELMRELSIARIDLDSLSFVADVTNGKGEKFEKHFKMASGEESVLYRKMGWDTMGCTKPLHQFLVDAQLHEPPLVLPVQQAAQSLTLTEAGGVDERPAAPLVANQEHVSHVAPLQQTEAVQVASQQASQRHARCCHRSHQVSRLCFISCLCFCGFGLLLLLFVLLWHSGGTTTSTSSSTTATTSTTTSAASKK